MKLDLDQVSKARLAQSDLELNRRKAHAIVVKMLRDKNCRSEVVSKAKEQIQKWRDGDLCSIDYIQEWETLLANPLVAADVLEAMNSFSIRMRQNSPFAAYLKL